MAKEPARPDQPFAALSHRGPERWAVIGSLVWVAVLAGWFFLGPSETQFTLPALVAAVLPPMVIWLGVMNLRMLRRLQAETTDLHAAVAALREAPATGGLPPGLDRKLEEIERATKAAETVLASFTSRRDATLSQPSMDRRAALATPAPPSPAEEQPALALGTPAEDPVAPLSVADFIRALQFPEGPEDTEGFRALRLALADRGLARLIRAAQDVLTLLSQDGIFMDDLRPERARPELWRSFCQGERGRGISGLGGIRDRSSLALTAGRMREDQIFRDAAHHFLRTFDRTFPQFEKGASDSDLVRMADTRTARAFMLIGRVAGIFD